MPRVATTNLGLGTWLDGENPGAGSQTVDNTGLNGNAIKIDTAVGTEHNTNGTHKAGSILKGYLATSVADGATIELDASAGLRIKALGVGSSHLAALSVIAGKIADGAVDTAARLAADVVTTVKILDANVTTAKLADDAVTAAKMSHDNNARKQYLAGMCKTGTTYLRISDVAVAHAFRMPRAGAITALTILQTVDSAGDKATQAYADAVAAASGKFAADDLISFTRSTSTGVCWAKVNSTNVTSLSVADPGSFTTDNLAVLIEYELDD